jgi:hypothetical protein
LGCPTRPRCPGNSGADGPAHGSAGTVLAVVATVADAVAGGTFRFGDQWR